MAGSPQVVVLGGGMCGLYAARTLAGRGVPVTLIEKEPLPGGLALGREFQGNFYDLGVHQLHAFDHEIFEDMKSLLGDRLHPANLKALICYGNGYRRYPLEFLDLLKSIPFFTLLRSVAGLMYEHGMSPLRRAPAPDAEAALVRLYGRPLYEFFFREFTTDYWGIPPKGLSATFVRMKMPRLSAVDVFKRALESCGLKTKETAVDSALAHETVWYTPTGAREMPLRLAAVIREKGGEVLSGSPVAAVETEGDRVTAVRVLRNGVPTRLPCTDCISTVPIPDLVRAMVPTPPEDVVEAAGQLHYKPIAVYGLLVKKPQVFDAMFVYFRHRIFHRIAEPKHSGLEIHPPDHSVLIVEMTCDEGDDKWIGGEATRRRILNDLEDEGLVRPGEVAEMHLLRATHGYPIFRLGFEPHHEKAKQYFARFSNLVSIGRQGGFCYPNMHTAMRMGMDAARRILGTAGTPDAAPAPAP